MRAFSRCSLTTEASRAAFIAHAAASKDDMLARFHAHFTEIYGERWQPLWAAMQQPTQHVAWAGPFSMGANAACRLEGWQQAAPNLPAYWPHKGRGRQRQQQQQSDAEEGGYIANGKEQQQQDWTRGLYLLDMASLFPALALAPAPGQAVADVCAAPGGKSLILAAQLFGGLQHPNDSSGSSGSSGDGDADSSGTSSSSSELVAAGQSDSHSASTNATNSSTSTTTSSSTTSGSTTSSSTTSNTTCSSHSPRHPVQDITSGLLVSNDRSRARRAALAHVLRSHLPPELIQRGAMRITGQDASKWPPAERRSYDRVLVDTPCSSERHLARSCAQGRPLLREDWSPSRSKRNGDTQLAILLSALCLVTPGGRLVYSTCSIAPTENDRVVARALSKAKGISARVVTADSWGRVTRGLLLGCEPAGKCEASEFGMIALPDRAGCGPLYWSVIEVE